MYKINHLMSLIEEVCPLSLSQKMIEKGSYDNSGLLVKLSDSANKILFSLDLSAKAVLSAIENGCDTIVTHHPAIYMPIKGIDMNADPALALAVKNGLNIVSMHLNLDVAPCGIDSSLCQGLGGENAKILEIIDGCCGYGRRAKIKEEALGNFVQKIKQNFNSDKIIFYGNKPVKKYASFCGSGASSAIENLDKIDDVDTIITSDIAHHQLKALIEKEKNVIIIPHYVSEQFGFYKFYETITEKLQKKAQTIYFLDNRFM